MEPKQVIETTGCITKVEKLINVEYFQLENTLVLESQHAFPGISSPSDEEKPGAIYFSTLYRYFPEKINRLAKALKEYFNRDWWSATGELSVKKKIYPFIRIKGLSRYDQIPLVQEFYKKNDIKFMPYKKINAEGKIKVYKHFKIIELFDGIYRDLYETEKFYFVIPEPINWNNLSYLTRHIKSTINNPEFDAALGTINRFNGPEDVIRIYDRDKTFERALDLRNQYNKALKKEYLLIRQKGSGFQ
ncbi:MAG: hypothetical protein JXK95_02695 [Bacteroidales bacterium]|nr:hypothetical protein [Bacteroidales bacterium]